MANRSWNMFLDPSDPPVGGLRDVSMTLPDGATGYYATGSYAANGLLPWGEKGGLPKLIPDGTTYTVMIAERPQVCRTASGEAVYNLWGLGFYSPHMPAFATLTPDDPPGLLSTGQLAPMTSRSSRSRDEPMQVRIGRQAPRRRRRTFRHRSRSSAAAAPVTPGCPDRRTPASCRSGWRTAASTSSRTTWTPGSSGPRALRVAGRIWARTGERDSRS